MQTATVSSWNTCIPKLRVCNTISLILIDFTLHFSANLRRKYIFSISEINCAVGPYQFLNQSIFVY